MIFLNDPRAQALKAWLAENDKHFARFGVSNAMLAMYLDKAESDADSLIEIRAHESVSGVPVTYRVTA